MQAALPSNETERLEALHRYEILDSPSERVFDDFTFLASHICGTPIALITLLDAERQWFKSKLGLDIDETPREVSFCSHAILHPDEVLHVPDATQDARFADNAFVTGQPNVRFYAGAPLVAPCGCALGALCVVDMVPRELTQAQRQALSALGRQVVAQLELRRQSADLERTLKKSRESEMAARRSEARASSIFETAIECILTFDTEDRVVDWNPSAERVFGYTREEAKGRLLVDLIVPERLRERHLSSLACGFTSGPGPVINARTEVPARRADGSEIVAEMAITRIAGQNETLFTSYLRDITKRKQAEKALSESRARRTTRG